MKAVFKTNRGNFEIEFMKDLAPKTVENFVKLAKEDFYNDTKFHRVIAGFMVQGGDPLSKNDDESHMWGMGGPGYQFDCEIHEANKNEVGSIAMANAGPNTNGSQFFINTNNNSFLNDKHTVFGKVVTGMDVIESIETVKTNRMDKPENDVVIESIEIVE